MGVLQISVGTLNTNQRLQTSDSLWNELHEAGEVEFDRFWRMPLDEEFGPQIYSSNADLCNVRKIRDLFSSRMRRANVILNRLAVNLEEAARPRCS